MAGDEEEKVSTEEVQFPDGGRGWGVVLGCFMVTAITLGFNLTWGVFQSHYLRFTLAGTSPTTLSFIGAIHGGLGSTVSVIIGKLGDTYGYKRFLVAGCVFTFLSTLFAAFSTRLWEFFLSQGVLQGLATGFTFPFIVTYPAQWFLKRRAFAISVVLSAAPLGGAVSGLIIPAMLERISVRKTLIIYSFIHFALLFCAIFLIKEGPGGEAARKARREQVRIWDFQLLKQAIFWSLALSTLFSTFGFFTPYFFLPTYTIDIHPQLSEQRATLPLSITNFSSAIGSAVIGWASDIVGPTNMLLVSLVVSGLSQLLIWNLAPSYGGIMAFAIVFGFFGGSFLNLLAPVAAQIYGINDLATITGILGFFLVPGNIAGGPVGGAIFEHSGSNWRAAISYSGAMFIMGALLLLYARFKSERRIIARF